MLPASTFKRSPRETNGRKGRTQEISRLIGRSLRARKFTEDQKRVAVEHYLSTGKNGSKTVRELGYSSRTLLSQWIDEIAPGLRKTTKPHKKFSDEKRPGHRSGEPLLATNENEIIGKIGFQFFYWTDGSIK